VANWFDARANKRVPHKDGSDAYVNELIGTPPFDHD
jgi:hypothetical protein